MKNKATVYVLGAMVAAVWGLIIYRVVAAVDDNDLPAVPVVAANAPKEPLNDYALVKDTRALQLNYPDPFAIAKTKAVKDTQQIAVSKLMALKPVFNTPKIVAPKPVMNWSFIRYSGYIRNPHTKKLIAMMSVNGKSLMLSEGESADQIKLLKNLKDSIKIAYLGKTKFIAINTDQP